MSCNRPHVGIGILILNSEGKVLLGKRKNSHAPFYSVPGGSLEAGETFEEGAIREAAEETGLVIHDPQVINVTNNLATYQEFDTHFVSITVLVKSFDGQPQVLEPEKCEHWDWYDLNDLPEPHFDASQFGIRAYLEKKFYIGSS